MVRSSTVECPVPVAAVAVKCVSDPVRVNEEININSFNLLFQNLFPAKRRKKSPSHVSWVWVWDISQICQLTGILGHISPCLSVSISSVGTVLLPIHSICLLSQVWIESAVPSWLLSPLSIPLLSFTQPAVGGGPNGDEEGGWGQCHLTVPPSVPVIQLSGHRVAPAEAQLQAESGKATLLSLFVLSAPFHSHTAQFGKDCDGTDCINSVLKEKLLQGLGF